MLKFEVFRGQKAEFDLEQAKTYFICNAPVLSFHLICIDPMILAIVIQTLHEVKKGQRSNHGHERSYGPEQKKGCHI